MTPASPLPTMGSPLRNHPLTPPPNITVRDIANSAADSITIVGAAGCHIMDEKPVHVKRRKGDPDGIALGEGIYSAIEFQERFEFCLTKER